MITISNPDSNGWTDIEGRTNRQTEKLLRLKMNIMEMFLIISNDKIT